MVKPRSKQGGVKPDNVDDKKIEALANKLADKPYGKEISEDESRREELERITITIPQHMRHRLEDIALKRKRAKQETRSVSALIREALEHYLQKFDEV